MVASVLDKISSPQDLKSLSNVEVSILAEDIRAEIIAATSQNGGHIGPSLGAVELIIAAHRVMDCPYDKLIFDVGHQAYAHKILTGRLDRFYALRQLDGISGFPKRKESVYDTHDSGHASDSLATALGLALARDLEGETQKILTIIGDAAMSGGLAFEALNQIGRLKKRMVIVLNDNTMSISPNVGAFASYLASLRTSQRYREGVDAVGHHLQKGLGEAGNALVNVAKQAKESFKQFLVPGMFFEELGITYLGPVDGHDLSVMEDMIRRAFKVDGPVVIHAITKKGKGFEPAEENQEKFHGVAPFECSTGLVVKKPHAAMSYTQAFSEQLIEEAAQDPDIVALTAAMPSGTGLDAFEAHFPSRFLDVGIAEECAVATASGLALAGKLPVVAIYSTFLQRAYDQIAINVCEQNLPVVFAIDRAGLVGEDGPTHHGVFDMSYLRLLPNMHIIAPSDEVLLKDALHTALRLQAPVALRYPRGSATGCDMPAVRKELPIAKARLVKSFLSDFVTKSHAGFTDFSELIYESRTLHKKKLVFFSIGRMLESVKKAAELLEEKGYQVAVFDMLWLKPFDCRALELGCSVADLVISVEEAAIIGGLGSAVAEFMMDHSLSCPLMRLGIEDAFVEQGSMSDLLKRVGLDGASIATRIDSYLQTL